MSATTTATRLDACPFCHGQSLETYILNTYVRDLGERRNIRQCRCQDCNAEAPVAVWPKDGAPTAIGWTPPTDGPMRVRGEEQPVTVADEPEDPAPDLSRKRLNEALRAMVVINIAVIVAFVIIWKTSH